ncbi:MAG: hypothetical protein ACTSUE_23330 [Promethearchaeota archaeon]
MKQRNEFIFAIVILAVLSSSLFIDPDIVQLAIIIAGACLLITWVDDHALYIGAYIIIILGFVQTIYAMVFLFHASENSAFSMTVILVLALRSISGLMTIANGFRVRELFIDRRKEEAGMPA